jgi:hypothetical protein
LRCHRPTETSRLIRTHANPRLTQRVRLLLVSQHLNQHRSLAELAAEAGISLRCACKWLARYRSGGAAALADRRSVRRSQRQHPVTAGLGAEDEVFSGGVEQVLIRASAGMICPGGSESYSG